ncbi:predicted protein [Lodderomyces elongisporus NRRL YB-4239]|uniref:Uncharacterized protein n=1 Tax=Lodderomyces elongisporus (strain ATCC 11503 / CBS 2605 / JCM 1781 / NBRC 1676 / NRRL YB-4239) TaxID=379508 RepID=A5DVF4_LODEL|nr:predicted protein [Lodderomyces elongisporus NRRL YB-4239]
MVKIMIPKKKKLVHLTKCVWLLKSRIYLKKRRFLFQEKKTDCHIYVIINLTTNLCICCIWKILKQLVSRIMFLKLSERNHLNKLLPEDLTDAITSLIFKQMKKTTVRVKSTIAWNKILIPGLDHHHHIGPNLEQPNAIHQVWGLFHLQNYLLRH